MLLNFLIRHNAFFKQDICIKRFFTGRYYRVCRLGTFIKRKSFDAAEFRIGIFFRNISVLIPYRRFDIIARNFFHKIQRFFVCIERKKLQHRVKDLCRTAADAPEVDGNVCVSSEEPLYPGEFYDVLVDDSDLYDLYGTVVK